MKLIVDAKMVKKHIILGKRANPVQVNLPDGRSFTSKWERISRKQLPINIKVTRNRAFGPKRNNRWIYFNLAQPAFEKIRKKRKEEAKRKRLNQTASSIVSNLLKARLDLGSKTLGSEFGKRPINKGIENIPNLFKFGASKVKNKNVK